MKNPFFSSNKLFYATLALVLLVGLVFLGVQNGRAGTTINVNSTLDSLANDGMCTLREAVIAANKDKPSGSKPNECQAGSGADTILLPNDLGDFVLTRTDNGKEDASATGDLDVLDNVTIQGDGPGVNIVAEEGFTDRVFHILAGQVSMQDLTIKGGILPDNGGGIRNESKLEIIGVTIIDNTAGGNGGAISNAPGAELTVANSTLSRNTAGGSGGGLYNEGTATLNNVTVAENIADSNTDNVGNGGGVTGQAGTLTIRNSIVAGNFDSSPSTKVPDCSGTLTSGGYNLIQDTSGCTISGDTATNLTGVSPLLGALGDNGGDTFTYEPGEGSPAIDAGNPAEPGSGGNACELTDQRGTFRPHGEACDIGAVEAGGPNASLIFRAFPEGDTTTVVGRLSGAPDTTFTLQFYTSTESNAVCSTSSGGTLVGEIEVMTDSSGNVIFTESLQTTDPVLEGEFIVASTIDPAGFSSDYSKCVRVGAGNDSWPRALTLTLDGYPNGFVSKEQYIDLAAQSRWFKFSVEPNSKVIVTLTGLPANYDLTVYKDIAQAFNSLTSEEDLLRLGAEFAPDAFAPDAFAPDAFAPDAFAPDAFAPDAFAPDAFAPDAFAPDAFAPDAFAPDAFAPDAFAPDAFAPDAFAPDAFAPDAFAPDAFAPDAFAPDAFASAQTRSLIAISAFDGTVSEGVLVNTWDNNTDFYIRVRGRNGAFNPFAPFHLEVRQYSGLCAGVSSAGFPASNLEAQANGYNTIILTNLGRMEGTQEEKDLLSTRLSSFAARPEVNGVIVDVSQDNRVAAAYDQSDTHPDCPAAQNLLASTIKEEVVDKYWALNTSLEYVVIVGNDFDVPFFRHPDHAMLANEQNYAPPVKNGTISQSSLRLGYVLSQDDYGAKLSVSYKEDEFPIPLLSVGRLVETASDATSMLDAYLSTPDGVIEPDSYLVTGYDFLEDAGLAVLSEFQAGGGAGGTYDTLITPSNFSPTDPQSWSADDLRAELLQKDHDVVFLAGHFSANSALAANFSSRMLASELANSTLDLRNMILFSAGCHVGYNIVDQHDVIGLTREPDWGQAAAVKGITLIGGTGYQFGDTDFIRYSERIYQEFSRQLRVGEGPVSIGQALVNSKRVYLSETPFMRGIDEKAVLEATIFGPPMLSVDMPGAHLPDTSQDSIVSTTNEYNTGPGAPEADGGLGLTFADVTYTTPTALTEIPLENVDGSGTSIATYYEGEDGIVVQPNDLVLPQQFDNVSVAGTVLRGVGFRGGAYSDVPDMLPYTGAPATEIRGVHAPFLTNVFWPITPYTTNYFNALANGVNGETNLFAFPAQFKSSSPSSLTGTWRTFGSMDFRVFYSKNIKTYNQDLPNESTPALAAAPSIAKVSSLVSDGEVTFRMRVVGNPAAGIQEVWVTYTAISGSLYGYWQSLDLVQNPNDSTLWEGTLTLPADVTSDQIRYIIQAVNGVGLVSRDTDQGRYYIPGAEQGPSTPTELTFIDPVPGSARYSTPVSLSAHLSSNGTPLEGQAVVMSLGPQSKLGITDASGNVTVVLSNYSLPGVAQLRASFAGAGDYQASYATSAFESLKQLTQIALAKQNGYPDEAAVLATLTDIDGHRLKEETLIFYVSGPGGTYGEALITDYAGRATLENLSLLPGSYTVDVYFSGDITPFGLILDDTRYEPAFATDNIILDNHVPEAVDDAYSVDEDGFLDIPAPGVLGNDSDIDEQTLSAILESSPSHGTLNLNADGSFSYTPDGDYNGTDSFTYAANDGIDSVSALVSITVNPVNDAPVAADDAYSIDEDNVLSVAAQGVLANDSDVDGDSLTAMLLSGPSNGSLTLNADGSFTYTPNANFNGSDSFNYKANDGIADSNEATVTITVNPVNDTPVALDDAFSTFEDTIINVDAPGILSNDTDVDGDVLLVSAVDGNAENVGVQITLTSGALLTVYTDGSFSYDPNHQFDTLAMDETAQDSFTYSISDGNGGGDTAVVNITIDGVNDPPYCTATTNIDSLWQPNGKFTLVTLSGETDPNGDPVTLTIQSVFQDETVGTEPDAIIYGDSVDLRAERDGNGDGRVYHITYVVDDGNGGSCTAQILIGVVPHDQSGNLEPIDGGALYDSTVPE